MARRPMRESQALAPKSRDRTSSRNAPVMDGRERATTAAIRHSVTGRHHSVCLTSRATSTITFVLTEGIPMKRHVIAVVFLFGALVVPSVARAWNGHGHMTIAPIAYRRLAPADRSKVDEILKSHPAFAEFMAKKPTRFA